MHCTTHPCTYHRVALHSHWLCAGLNLCWHSLHCHWQCSQSQHCQCVVSCSHTFRPTDVTYQLFEWSCPCINLGQSQSCIWPYIAHARTQLTCNSQWIALCSHWLCAFSNSNNSTCVGPIVTAIPYIHHQDVVLLDPGCPLRINCSCITRAPRTGPLIAQHSGGWHSYNSAHQNQGSSYLRYVSVGVGINDNCTEMVVRQAG